MKCSCGKNLKIGWKFCPYCGKKIFSFENEIEKFFEELFPIKIKVAFSGNQKQYKKFNLVEEPEVKIKKFFGRTEIEVFLPDVSSPKEINIKELDESLEIRAYSKEKMYFKLIPIRKGELVVEKIFKNGKLKLILGKF